MGRMARMAAVVAALATASVAAQAHAQAAKPKARADNAAAFASDQNAWAPKAKSLQWNGAGRWALKLDVDQPATRDVEWKDVEAGAYFRLTPSLRVGGSVGLDGSKGEPRRVTPDEKPQPRVRLETTFRF